MAVMRDGIWYREELLALQELVLEEMKRGVRSDIISMLGQLSLAHLYEKLDKAIASAPSAKTPEVSS